jgi:hypothetical protein
MARSPTPSIRTVRVQIKNARPAFLELEYMINCKQYNKHWWGNGNLVHSHITEMSSPGFDSQSAQYFFLQSRVANHVIRPSIRTCFMRFLSSLSG